jgi:hypothetical protein
VLFRSTSGAEYIAILWDAYHTGPTTFGWFSDESGAKKAWADPS